MSKHSQNNGNRRELTVKISPATLEFCGSQIEQLANLAGIVALDATETLKAVRELREQFESVKVLVGDIMKGGKV